MRSYHFLFFFSYEKAAVKLKMIRFTVIRFHKSFHSNILSSKYIWLLLWIFRVSTLHDIFYLPVYCLYCSKTQSFAYIKDPICEKFILAYFLLLFKKFSCLSNVNDQVFLKYDDAWLWPWPMKKSGWDNDLVWMIFFVSVLLWFSVLASHHVNHFTIKRAVVFPFLSIYVYECTLIYVII